MFSKFITVFLTANYLHSTCASPIVSEDTVIDSQLLDLTDTVATQAGVLAPPDQLCDRITQWRYRKCISTLLDRAWLDWCYTGTALGKTKFGSCPVNTMCMNTLFRRTTRYGRSVLTRSIYCLSRPKTRQESPVVSIAVSAMSGQVGFIPINTFDLSSTSQSVPVKVGSTLANVSITAMIEGAYQISKLIIIWQLTVVKYEGTDDSYLVEPNAPLVGVLRSTNTAVCVFNATTRECEPLRKINISSGSYIDFSFGLQFGQSVNFYYGILQAG
jgi:hypothetical protein